MHECEGEVEAPAHPARVAAHLAVRGLGEADPRDQLVAPARRVGLGQAVHSRLEAHVVARREELVERRLLQRDADRVANRRALLDDVVARDPRGARGRGQERGEHVDGGRLARAVGPEKAVDLARLDLAGRCRRRPAAPS